MNTQILIALIGALTTGIASIIGFRVAKKQATFGLTTELQKRTLEAHFKAWGSITEWSDRVEGYVGKSSDNRKKWIEKFMSFWYSPEGYGLLIEGPVRSALFAVVNYLTHDVERDGTPFDELKFVTLKRVAQRTLGEVIGHTKESKNKLRLEWFREE